MTMFSPSFWFRLIPTQLCSNQLSNTRRSIRYYILLVTVRNSTVRPDQSTRFGAGHLSGGPPLQRSHSGKLELQYRPNDRTQNVLNIQPVIPINAGKEWSLIIRWIVPVIYQPVGVQQPLPQAGDPPSTQSGVYGFGDMQPAFFLSPKKGKVIWGVGPQLLLPTATKTGVLGQGKFGMGPSAVLLVLPGKWTVGALFNYVWSVAGHSNLPDVNQFLLQYFINYNLSKGWYLSWQPTLTANWEAPMVVDG